MSIKVNGLHFEKDGKHVKVLSTNGDGELNSHNVSAIHWLHVSDLPKVIDWLAGFVKEVAPVVAEVGAITGHSEIAVGAKLAEGLAEKVDDAIDSETAIVE